MRVAVNLLALPSYLDRFQMLCALSDRVERLHLLTDTCPPALAERAREHPRLRVVPLGWPGFRPRAEAWLDARVRGPGLDIVHDTFNQLTRWLQVVGPRPDRRFRLLTTLYTSNDAWFREARHNGMDLDLRYITQRTLNLWRTRRITQAVDCTLVLGPGHEHDLTERHHIPATRIEWIPSEIDTTGFCPGDAPREGGPVLLYTGTVFRNKGIDVLIEAARRLRERWPGLRLELLGNIVPWERRWFDEAVAAAGLAGVVRAPGHVPRAEVLERYRRADLYVFPSRFEGSPRSVREAVACGCPAVVSDIPGNRGIDPAGDFLRFVPPTDVGAWVEAIDGLLREPAGARDSRSARGVEHLRRHHTPEAVADRLVGIYHRLLSGPPWSAGRRT